MNRLSLTTILFTVFVSVPLMPSTTQAERKPDVDPILQGIGLTLPTGALVSTVLTLGIVPIVYYQCAAFLHAKSVDSDVAACSK